MIAMHPIVGREDRRISATFFSFLFYLLFSVFFKFFLFYHFFHNAAKAICDVKNLFRAPRVRYKLGTRRSRRGTRIILRKYFVILH